MTLDRIILNVWTKLVINIEYRKDQQDKNLGLRLTKYEAL